MAVVRTAVETDIPRIPELYRQLAMNPEELEMLKAELEFSREMFREMADLNGYYHW